MHLDSVNITFGLFKIFYFSWCLFSIVFTWNFILFPGDLLKKLGKFLTTLHSSNSSSVFFHVVLNISFPFLMTLSTGSLFTWLSILLYPIFGCDPLSYFIPSTVVSLHSIIAHSIFFPFPSVTLVLSVSLRLVIFVSWFSEMKGLN